MAMFTGRDLALFLPDKAGDAVSLRHTAVEEDNFEVLKPRIDPSKKVVRYFPGKAPTWVDEESPLQTLQKATAASGAASTSTTALPQDRRLARLAAASQSQREDSTSAPARRRIYEAEVVVDEDDGRAEDEEEDEDSMAKELLSRAERGEDDDDDEAVEGDVEIVRRRIKTAEDDEDDIAARRQRVLQKLAASRNAPPPPSSSSRSIQSHTTSKKTGHDDDEDGDEEDDDSDEYTDDDDDEEEEEDLAPKFKPVFVPRSKRDTIKEAEQKEEEALLREKRQQIQLEQRKSQTRSMVAETLRRKEDERLADANTDNDSDAGLPDDTDDMEDEMEFESWRLREMSRLKRDAELREEVEVEKAELLRRRGLTEEERLAEDTAAGRFEPKEKKKWKFMQKYYHKGVFYMDDESITKGDVRERDFDEPTLEDKFDREALPAVLQVKKFGFRGRTKYTHLVDQDTTYVNYKKPPQGSIGSTAGASSSSGTGGGAGGGGTGGFLKPLRVDEHLQQAYLQKRAGLGSIDDAGRLKKKAKP